MVKLNLRHHLEFLRTYLAQPNVVGAFAPSSKALAEALCEPVRTCPSPAAILEVGAGTGAITGYLGQILKREDRLDICEVNGGFADILERDVLTLPCFRDAVSSGRVRLIRCPVQEIKRTGVYDFVISCLPLTVFELHDVEEVFATFRRSLKPHGVLSYFEYVGMRRTSRVFALGNRRRRIRAVSAYLSDQLRHYQFDRRTVFQNFPPAHARYLRFAPAAAFQPALGGLAG